MSHFIARMDCNVSLGSVATLNEHSWMILIFHVPLSLAAPATPEEESYFRGSLCLNRNWRRAQVAEEQLALIKWVAVPITASGASYSASHLILTATVAVLGIQSSGFASAHSIRISGTASGHWYFWKVLQAILICRQSLNYCLTPGCFSESMFWRLVGAININTSLRMKGYLEWGHWLWS